MTLQLPELPYLRIRFVLEAERDARLPAYKGSMLRGAFGHALRRTVCAMGPRQPCETCTLNRSCTYPKLFEAFAAPESPPFLEGQPAAPRPFVFEPHETTEELQAGDQLSFDLLLFGNAVELQAFAVVAVERMAAKGLGVRRHRFFLRRASYQSQDRRWHPGYEKDGRRWTAAPPSIVPAYGSDPPTDRLCLRFLTPTRIKDRGRFVDRFDFPVLAFRMIRRAFEMAHFYGPSEDLDWSVEPVLERAREVRVAESRLHWRDVQRYSSRQRSKITLGGVVGEMVLEGPLDPFLPLLRVAEVVHVGKGATLGLGRVEILRL